jgi:hypothetical protein
MGRPWHAPGRAPKPFIALIVEFTLPQNVVVSINASQKSFYLLYQEPGPYGVGYPRG